MQVLSRSLLRRALPVPPTSSSLLLITRHASSPSSSSPPKPKRILDELIPYKTVSLVDPETQSLLPPAPLIDILSSLDRQKFSIHLVDSTPSGVGIGRILVKKDVYDKEKEKKEKKKAKDKTAQGGAPKEVQLTWQVSKNDLGHKLNKAKELLGKGHRVVIILTRKKDGEAVSEQLKSQVVKDIEGALDGVGKLRAVEKGAGQTRVQFETVP